jgi:hypothetical protein
VFLFRWGENRYSEGFTHLKLIEREKIGVTELGENEKCFKRDEKITKLIFGLLNQVIRTSRNIRCLQNFVTERTLRE